MIKIKNLTKTYKEDIILKDINISFGIGKYVIKGSNGSGKTTLINILTKIDDGYIGEITIDGKNYKEISKEEYLSNYISYAVQKNEFIDNCSINELVDFFVQDFNKDKKEELIKILELDNLINKPYKVLSGGEKQKVKLLIAFLKESKILILDEPFNNLDKKSINKIMDLIENEKNKLVIIVDHNIELYPFEYNLVEVKENKVYLTENLNKENIKYEDIKGTFTLNIKNKIKLNIKNLKYGYFLLFFMIIFGAAFLLLSFELGQQVYKLNAYSGVQKGNMVIDIGASVDCDTVCAAQNKESFSNEDAEDLKKIEGIENVKALYTSIGSRVVSPVIPQQNYMISERVNVEDDEFLKYMESVDASEVNVSNFELGASTMLAPKEIAQKFPTTVFTPTVDKILYGNYPNDNENKEVLISEVMASYYAHEMNLNSIESLIGKEIQIPTKAINIKNNQIQSNSTYEEVNQNFKVVGIYSSNIYSKQDIYFGYDENSNMYISNSNEETLEEEQIKDMYDNYNEQLREVGNKSITYEEYLKLKGDGIGSIYISYDPENEKQIYETVISMYPNNLIISHYGVTFGSIGQKLLLSIILNFLKIILVILLLIILLLFLSQQYYQIKLKQQRLFMTFGMKRKDYNIINFSEIIIYILFSGVIGVFLFNTLFLHLNIKVAIFVFIIFIIVQIIVFIMNLKISNLLYKKYLNKLGVK